MKIGERAFLDSGTAAAAARIRRLRLGGKAMYVEEAMSRPVETIEQEDTLNSATKLMLDRGCGSLAVIDAEGRLIGILTDRDICRTAHVVGEALWRLRVADAMTREVHTVRPRDLLETAAQLMRKNHVRRLPVVEDGRLTGMLSIDDLARAANTVTKTGSAGPTAEEVLRTLLGVIEHPARQTATH
jgi:CBS domain-containing protein